jgi:hypothetical protein
MTGMGPLTAANLVFFAYEMRASLKDLHVSLATKHLFFQLNQRLFALTTSHSLQPLCSYS